MNKKTLFTISGISILIIGAVAYVAFSRGSTPEQSDVSPITTAPVTTTPQTNEQSNQPGAYVDYSEAAVSEADGTKILFFHASWCPQCRELDESIQSAQLPNNLTIFKVDYDSNQALRQKYEVTLQTTLVKIDNKGTKLASYVAYDEPTFANIERELLP